MHNPMDLSGQRILVTGASSGLGRDASILLSELGAQVILVARDVPRLESTLGALTGSGHAVEPCDLSKADQIEAWLKRIAKSHGALTGLVHGAGVVYPLPIRAISIAKFEELISINLTAAFALSRTFRTPGVCTRPSSIVFISSASGLVGNAGLSAYCASKGGLINMAKALAVEFAREKIRVNCVAPGMVGSSGMVDTFAQLPSDAQQHVMSQHLLGFGEARDVSNSIAFLLSNASRWITGTALVVDGGLIAH